MSEAKKTIENGDFFPRRTSLDDWRKTVQDAITPIELYTKIDGVLYRWVGGMGCQLESVERREVNHMDCRKIGGVWFYAYRIERTGLWRKRKVSWSCCKDLDAADVRRFRAQVFMGQ